MHSLLLSEADELRLTTLLKTNTAPIPSIGQKTAVAQLLADAKISDNSLEHDNRIGFYDTVTLVSPKDSSDYFRLKIVMPAEANPDNDLISIVTPLCLSLIGKKIGDLATWQANGRPREMRIISIQKTSLMQAV